MKKEFNTPMQRDRRKIARDVAALYDDIAREAGFEPIERRTAFAISALLYEYDNADPDTPRRLTLVRIGKWLTSKSDDEEACRQAATRHVGQLFNHAIPRTGFQILTRYKSEQGSNKAHEYGHDRIMQAAAFFSELLAEEKRSILANKDIEKGEKHQKIEEARARLVADALTYLPVCEVELVTPEGDIYAYVSASAAKAYCAKNPDYVARAYKYSEPEPDAKPKRPLCGADFERLKDRAVRQAIDSVLDEIVERNSFEEARLFLRAELLPALNRAAESWTKVEGGRGDEEHEELYTRDKSDMPDPVENLDGVEEPSHDKLSCDAGVNSFADNADENDTLETDPVENPTGSINFDTSLEAALFYVRDGWAVVPCCQFNPATGRCTGPDKHHEGGACQGKVPLIRGASPTPGAGYTAASRDKGLIADWFNRQFPNAGIAIRLDGHILIDCDVKDGARGIESYEFLRDTFGLDATLSAITPSGGRHYIFKLPEDLPADYLGSWTRVLDVAELDGIDLKVGNKGLCHVEPTMGKNGSVYRWIDPCAEIAELPRACCDYLHHIHEQATKPQPKAAGAYDTSATFDPDEDQAKFFKDRPNGQRRPRLRSIACCLAAGGANEEQIVTALHYHDSRFTEPTHDAKYIVRVAQGAVSKFRQGVSQ